MGFRLVNNSSITVVESENSEVILDINIGNEPMFPPMVEIN